MKIKAFREEWADRMGFILYHKNEQTGKRYIVLPIQLKMKLQEEGDIVEPTFRIEGHEEYEFIKSMAEIAEEMGIKTDKQAQEESKNKGALDAIKYHLEDMRTLVFKKK